MSATSPERHPGQGGGLLERGFSLVSAIFLLVILSALGVFMLSLSTMQQTTSTLDMQGGRAYQAARAGVEWGVYHVMAPENANPAAGGVAQYVCPASASSLPALAGSLSGFSVKVICSSTVHAEGGNLVTAYQLTATASFGAAPASSYVERSITASILTCRTEASGPSC